MSQNIPKTISALFQSMIRLLTQSSSNL